MKDVVRIGGASGFWGDSVVGPLQLVAAGVDYLVFDYLAELTMSLLAGARAKDPNAGYATDFVDVAMRAVLTDALARGTRIVANAGGVNPRGCAAALEKLAAELGVAVRVAVVEGDDVLPQLAALRAHGVAELQDGRPLPERVLSANAYLGAVPIAQALALGADVVITGRCVDSAVTVGALMHEFGWAADDLDRLAMGSLAGHLIECGCQGVGGLFTDWDDVPDWPNSGYPIVECRRDGSFAITKPEGTGGLVTPATVAEQLVYEIGDPARYVLPDVVCDFTGVELAQAGAQRVEVRGARGFAAPRTYKVSATYADGFRATAQLTIVGIDAERKARRTADAILARTRALFARNGWGDFAATHVEVLGGEFTFERAARAPAAALHLAVAHGQRAALEMFAREIAPAATSWAPGTTGFGGRPSVVPAIKQYAFLVDKTRLAPTVLFEGRTTAVAIAAGADEGAAAPRDVAPAGMPPGETVDVALVRIAHARSGDKGDTSNIGVIARRPELVPVLRAQLTEDAVAAFLAPLVQGRVTRYELPGIHALNFVCERALGGGGMASLRHDPLGKGMAQLLLQMRVRCPRMLLGGE